MSDQNPLDKIELFNGLRDYAETLHIFFDHLRDVGFGEREALTLTQEWMRVTGISSNGSDAA